MAHVRGQSRYQVELVAPALDDLVRRDHPVRVIDAFVDTLYLRDLGFARVEAEATGRPPYAPGDLLRLYIYGYMNQMRSSRRLEREAARNLEVMWLIDRVQPSFKTIADFRKDHAEAIVKTCRAFVLFCRRQSLMAGETVAIDGTKVAAVASFKQVITPRKLADRLAAVERKIKDHLQAMDEADRQEEAGPADRVDVMKALEALKAQRATIERQARELAEQGLKQRVEGEREARLMRTAREGRQVAYNAQIAVDGAHKLIAAFDLTNECNDERQLLPMARQARQALDVETLTVVADTGYSNGEQASQCAEAGITAIAPRPEMVNPKGEQFFTRDAFAYDAAADAYRCPAGQTLTCGRVSQTEQKKEYWSKACPDCPLKAQCTPANRRSIVRSFHEDARQAMHARAAADPKWMRLRRCVAEHPFGTTKWMMGRPRFLVRGLKKAGSEWALAVLGYNIKRTIEILGPNRLIEALNACPA
jgi:transposase